MLLCLAPLATFMRLGQSTAGPFHEPTASSQAANTQKGPDESGSSLTHHAKAYQW
jgi:hypothetical protein